MTTDRERFTTVLANGPLLKSDAIILLCGEDAVPRATVAAQLLRTGGGPFIVASGGKHEPPRCVDAEHIAPKLYALGIAPERVIVESQSQNTREQAVACVSMAVEESWHRLLLVASAYHMPRAFLTFLKAIQDAKAEDAIQLIAAPASQVPWWGSPEGMTETRLELLDVEYRKIDEYREHVATYADGLAYLQRWEGK